MTAAVEITDLTKTYGAVRALRGVSMTVQRGEVLALCGHNGAGKSTLVKVLKGLVRPDGGTVLVAGEEVSFSSPSDAQRHGVAVVDQELSIVPDLTVQENLRLGNVGEPFLRAGRAQRDAARALLKRVGLEHLDPSKPARELLLGERQLLEVARLLGRDAQVLIFDEPTATLSDPEIERVFAAIRQLAAEGRSVIFVSHRLSEVLSLCDRVVVLRDGRDVAAANCADIAKEQLTDLMLGEHGREREIPRREIASETHVALRDVSVFERLDPLSLDIPGGMIVGVAGQIGSGASELLRALAGLDASALGSVKIAGTPLKLGSVKRAQAAGVHYVTNDRKADGLFLEQSVAANLTASRLRSVASGPWLKRSSVRKAASTLATRVGVDPGRLDLPVGTFSGGNQQKTLIGRCLDRDDLQVLLLDEPTRGVDVGGRADIHRLVREVAAAGVSVIFASTELDEVLELSDLIVTLYDGRIVSTLTAEEATTARVLADMTHGHPLEAAA